MTLRSSTPGTVALYQTAVTVQIWEGYLLRSQSNIARILCTCSLDNGPLQETPDGYLHFRFTEFDWNNTLQSLLAHQHIHYTIAESVVTDPCTPVGRKNIYIAEPEAGIASVLTAALRDAGYHVQTTASGKEIMRGHFGYVDLFVIDCTLQNTDGLTLCRHLRLRPNTKDIPVIIISSNAHSTKEALLAGANDLIKKPFPLQYFLNVVSRYTTPNDNPRPSPMAIVR